MGIIVAEINKLNQAMYDEMVEMYEKGKHQLAIETGKALLEQARRLKDVVSEKKALEVLSYASYFTVNYIDAMTYMIQFSKMVEGNSTIEEDLRINSIFFSIYTRQGEYDEAEKILNKVVQIARANNLHEHETKTQNNYGFLYNASKQYDKAILHLEEGLKLSELYHYTEIVPTILGNLALSYLRTGRIEKAKHTLDKVFLSLKDENHGIARAEAYMYKGEVLALEGHYEEAIIQIKASKMISLKNGYTAELSEAIHILSEVYEKMGDYENAYKELVELMPLIKKLSEKSKEGALIKLKMQHDLNKKDLETDVLRNQYAVLEEQNKKIQCQAKELERLNSVLGRQNAELHHVSREDYLTGVYNRRFFTLKMQEEFSIAKEKNKSIACIIFDIDVFKNINDGYGHLIGDEVIKHISSVCQESLEDNSIIGRFGGDEFMILMLDATIEDAEDKANNLIENLKEKPLMVDRKVVPVTISLGVSDNHFNQPKTTDDMIGTADKGLYLAKAKGRNRCCRMATE